MIERIVSIFDDPLCVHEQAQIILDPTNDSKISSFITRSELFITTFLCHVKRLICTVIGVIGILVTHKHDR